MRLEWHQVGSTDGALELVNDQVGYAGGSNGTPIYTTGSRTPTSANAIYINANTFTSATTINGLSLSANSEYNTYDPTNYNLATGKNLLGGVNRVQFSVGENPLQVFSQQGTGSVFATPGAAGFGKGNTNVTTASPVLNGLGVAKARQQLTDQSVVNFGTNKLDPQTGVAYAAGAWNTAGTNNIHSQVFAVDSVTISANPATGLLRLNKGDAQWLQTSSRLQNGATFNFAERDVNAGQRNIPALETGIDPSYAVGLNDGGNSTTNSAAQHSIGPNLRFSGKTTGSELRSTIAQNRAGVGVVSISEALGAVANAPIRALDIDFTDQTDPLANGQTDTTQFVRDNFDNLVSGSYKASRNLYLNTIQAPDAQYGTANPNIKGDNKGDVGAFLNNITQTVASYSNGSIAASIANPADGLLANGYMLPGLLTNTKAYSGGPLISNNLTPDQVALQQAIKGAYSAKYTTDGTNADNSSTIGTNSTYGALGTTGTLNGAVKITAANYLLGNFNQNGTRDLSSVETAVGAALALRHADPSGANSIFSGISNTNVISTGIAALDNLTNQNGTTGATKGDLVVLGDYRGSGAFDGANLYALATGASLADSASTNTISLTTASGATFADQVRNPNAVLRKNDALIYINGQLNPTSPNADQLFLLQTAAVQSSANPKFTLALAATNAFNRFDVYRDGVIDLADAAVVDKFVGKNPGVLTDQVAAVVSSGASNAANIIGPSSTNFAQTSFNVFQAQLVDGGGAISNATNAAGTSDFKQVHDYLNRNSGSGTNAVLLDGDTQFRGTVDLQDYLTLAQNFHATNSARWSQGDFNFDGKVDLSDYLALARNFHGNAGTSSGNVRISSAKTLSGAATPAVAPALINPGVGQTRPGSRSEQRARLSRRQ